MRGVLLAAALIALPTLAFTLWPLLRRGGGARTFLALPPDPREPLLERKRQVLRALREIDFEHDAGHVSDDDWQDLRARYEAEAAALLAELDRLGPAGPPPPARAPAAPPGRRGWRHPVAVATGAAALLVFGIALGAGLVRYTAPDPGAGMPPPGSRPLAPLEPPAGAPGGGPPGPAGGGRLTPEMLGGMLQAARQSLFAGRYGEAITAYQAVLKREPKNVDALTHLGLIVALGGHTDAALETLDRALAIDPDYPPALLYRGQVLLESRRDVEAAVRSWERFLRVARDPEERERVQRMIAEARAGLSAGAGGAPATAGSPAPGSPPR